MEYRIVGFWPCHARNSLWARTPARREAAGSAAAGTEMAFPLLRPEDFDARGFELPQRLSHTSFHPARFVQSCLRRAIAAIKK